MHVTLNIAYNYLKCASFFCTAFSIRMTAICMHKALACNNKKKQQIYVRVENDNEKKLRNYVETFNQTKIALSFMGYIENVR